MNKYIAGGIVKTKHFIIDFFYNFAKINNENHIKRPCIGNLI